MREDGFIVIVSGLPRSGTSVMMQMLAAGGMRILTDEHRLADIDNPGGYYELEAVKSLKNDRRFLDEASGKAVKVVHAMLTQLPLDRDYRVIFMRRDLDEVLASQRKMLDRLGRAGAALSDTQLKTVYLKQLQQVRGWLAAHVDCIRVLEMEYRDLVSDPTSAARTVNTFLDGKLDEVSMKAAVNPSLYRNRRSDRDA